MPKTVKRTKPQRPVPDSARLEWVNFDYETVTFFAPADAQVPEKETRGIAPPEEDVQRNLELLTEAVVDLEVLLDGSTMMFGELAALQTGQVLTFDHALGKPVRAVVNGAIGMPGHVVSAGRKRAFQIEELP